VCSPTGSSSSSSSNSNLSNGAIAGIVIGCVAGVAIFLLIIFGFILRSNQRNASKWKSVSAPEDSRTTAHSDRHTRTGEDEVEMGAGH